jgi:hypothetical protein
MHEDSYRISSNQTYTKIAAFSCLYEEKPLIMNWWFIRIIWTPTNKESV